MVAVRDGADAAAPRRSPSAPASSRAGRTPARCRRAAATAPRSGASAAICIAICPPMEMPPTCAGGCRALQQRERVPRQHLHAIGPRRRLAQAMAAHVHADHAVAPGQGLGLRVPDVQGGAEAVQQQHRDAGGRAGDLRMDDDVAELDEHGSGPFDLTDARDRPGGWPSARRRRSAQGDGRAEWGANTVADEGLGHGSPPDDWPGQSRAGPARSTLRTVATGRATIIALRNREVIVSSPSQPLGLWLARILALETSMNSYFQSEQSRLLGLPVRYRPGFHPFHGLPADRRSQPGRRRTGPGSAGARAGGPGGRLGHRPGRGRMRSMPSTRPAASPPSRRPAAWACRRPGRSWRSISCPMPSTTRWPASRRRCARPSAPASRATG